MKKIDYYEICKLKLKYLNYSDKTINNYLGYIRKFLNNIDNEPSRLNSNDFQSYLDKYNFTSISNQTKLSMLLGFSIITVKI